MNVFAKLLMGSILLLSVRVASAQNVDGVLKVVKGDVQIKSAKTGQTVKARLGEKVFPKDVVITGKDARAKIVMVDNNEINVSPESQIEIQHYEFDPNAGKKEVLLNVIYGKVRAKVEQKYDGKTSKFQVKTPSAVAGVRGTDFMTSYNKVDNSSQVVTFRGAVEFGLPGPGGTITNPVSVTPGKTAQSVAGAAPAPPTNMPKGELAKMDNETKADAPAAPGAKSDRAPSNDGKGDGDKKSDGDKKGDAAGTKSDSGGGDKRAPASTGPGPTKDVGFDASKDSAACTTCNPPPAVVDTGAKSIPQAPIIAAPPPPCTLCNQAPSNTKVNVHVK